MQLVDLQIKTIEFESHGGQERGPRDNIRAAVTFIGIGPLGDELREIRLPVSVDLADKADVFQAARAEAHRLTAAMGEATAACPQGSSTPPR